MQLTPKNGFSLCKSPCFSDHRCEKITVVAIFVYFLSFFKVPKFDVSVSHGRAIAKNGASWPVLSSKDYKQCFAHEENVGEFPRTLCDSLPLQLRFRSTLRIQDGG